MNGIFGIEVPGRRNRVAVEHSFADIPRVEATSGFGSQRLRGKNRHPPSARCFAAAETFASRATFCSNVSPATGPVSTTPQ